MNKPSILFLFALIVIIWLAFINLKASIITLAILILSLGLFYFAKMSKNLVLLCFVLFFVFTNLIGVPHAIINSESFQYSGWKAIKDFDFTYGYFVRVYSIAFMSVFLLIYFVYCLGKIKYFKVPRFDVFSLKLQLPTKKFKYQSFYYSLLIVLILILIVVVSVVGFQHQIGLSGVAPTKLPFKMVGILHFGRSLVAPFIILLLASRTNLSWLLRFFIIVSGLLIGIFSGSRGTTLFYLLPLILDNWQKISLKSILFKLSLMIAGFSIATASQAIYTLSPGLNWYQQLNVLFEIGLDPYDSMQGSISEFVNQILGIVHRFYGFQDYVLAYQYEGSVSIQNFFSFVFSGNPDYFVKDVTYMLYGLEFPEGSSFGVAMGLIGIAIVNFNLNILVLILLLAYIALLIVFANKVLISFQSFNELSHFFDIIYFVSSLVLSLILISGRIDFFYLVISSILALRFIYNLKLKFFKTKKK